MASLLPEDIQDFVTLTLSHFKRGKWTDLSMDHTEYVSARIINEKNVVEQGGKDISFRLQTRNTGLARNTGLFAQDQTGVEDLMVSASCGWAMQTVNWSYDVYEDVFQSDEETIIREMVVREHAAQNDMVELNEENLWTAPTGTTDDRPFGIPFWLQKDASTTAEGAFNGGNPSGFTAGRAGLSSTTYPKWRNWTFGYTTVTQNDLVRKVKKALYATRFKAPNPHPSLGFGESKYHIFTTYAVREPLERLAESRNDNLGTDVAKYINTVTIGGVPLEAVPYLDANDSSDPLYGVNWKWMRPYVKKGVNMRRNKPKQSATQHNVYTVHTDNAMNYICYNLREMWVGSKA